MRIGLRVGEIIAAIRSGKLQIGRQDDVTPFAPDGQDFGPIYERKDAEPVLIAARSRRQYRS